MSDSVQTVSSLATKLRSSLNLIERQFGYVILFSCPSQVFASVVSSRS